MTKGEYCRLKRIHTCKPAFNPNEEMDAEFKENIDKLVSGLVSIDKKETADGGVQYQYGL